MFAVWPLVSVNVTTQLPSASGVTEYVAGLPGVSSVTPAICAPVRGVQVSFSLNAPL